MCGRVCEKVLNFVHKGCMKPEGVSPTISSLLFDQAAEVNTSDPAQSTLTSCMPVFCVGVCVLANPAAGQLMKKRRRGQSGLAVAWCGIGLLLVGNEEWAAQEEEEQANKEE